MHTSPVASACLAFALMVAIHPATGDTLSELPERWLDRLAPVAETDLSGAERLMQEAVPEARAQVQQLLLDERPDPAALAGAYGRLGALFLLLEIEAQADLCFRNAHALQPAEFRWPYYRGYLAMMAGNADQALEQLEAAAAIDADYPTLSLRLGKVRLDRNELPEAKAALEKVTKIPGLAAAAHYYSGQIAVMERAYDQAVAHLQQALAADPDIHAAHYPLAQAYRALGKTDLARKHLKRFQPGAPAVEDPLLDQLKGTVKRSLPNFQKAIHAIRQGDYALAAEHFAKGLAVDPENARARVSFARALYLSGQRNESEQQLDQALAAEPNLILANFLRGVLAQERGDLENAAHGYRRTLELEPNHAGAMFYLANLDFAKGNYEAAAQGYASALSADTQIPPARLMALISRYRAGEAEADIAAAFETLLEAHPDDQMLQYAFARLLASAHDKTLRKPQQALEFANRLALSNPVPPHQRLQALALAAAGDFAQAAQLQQRIIAMSAWASSRQEQEIMQWELTAYESEALPPDPWPLGDVPLSSPPFDPIAPFRDYPAAVPY